jgi:hypothetical protein
MDMLKIVSRIFVILLIIALVGAAIYALVQNTSLGASFGRGDLGNRAFTAQGIAFVRTAAPSGQSFSPNLSGERGEGRFSFSLGRGLGGVMGNSIAIGVITLIVVLVRRPKAPRLLRVRPVSIDQP